MAVVPDDGLVLPDRSDPEPPWPWCHPGSCRPVRQGRVKVHATGRACVTW